MPTIKDTRFYRETCRISMAFKNANHKRYKVLQETCRTSTAFKMMHQEIMRWVHRSLVSLNAHNSRSQLIPTASSASCVGGRSWGCSSVSCSCVLWRVVLLCRRSSWNPQGSSGRAWLVFYQISIRALQLESTGINWTSFGFLSD